MSHCNVCSFLVALLAGYGSALAADVQLRIVPTTVTIDRPESTEQLLVLVGGGVRWDDKTRTAEYRSSNPQVATVSKRGRVVPHGDGEVELQVSVDGHSGKVRAVVKGFSDPAPVSFRHDVVPILSKSGCNSGGCHGKAEGKNGFRLSIFGFDPAADYGALVMEGRGRRVSLAAPAQSLLLRKATGESPHGGGRKIAPNSQWLKRLRRWVAEGAPLDDAGNEREIVGLEVYPPTVVVSPNGTQQLRVVAIDRGGVRRCATTEADFSSNADTIATADDDGLVRVSETPGEAAILVRYMGRVAVSRITLPQDRPAFPRPKSNNFVDDLVWNKLAELGAGPSPLADDSTFVRRVFLDTIGRLPDVDEVRAFLRDDDPMKRSQLIDSLLAREEYSDYFAMMWADVLRVDREQMKPPAAVAMTRWLQTQFRENTPYDEMVRRIITATGATVDESPAAYFVVHKDAESLSKATSQLFLGVRIECAQCHHHPFERWSQRDYYALAGFFTGVTRQGYGDGSKITWGKGSDLKHPRTGELTPFAPPGEAPLEAASPDVDRRVLLAEWITRADNPFFARMGANRLWAHYFGRGLYEPVDDLRDTNPAANGPLLDALAAHLVEVKFDLKAFSRTLLNSRVYQLQPTPNESNALDEQNFSRAAWKPLPAEVLLDAISQTTEIAEQFNGWPEGYRAVQVWDSRMPSHFFRVFGKPQRVSVCACERTTEPSIAQALHLMNSPESVRKIRHRRGRAARLAGSEMSPAQVIEELYLAALARTPNDAELQLMMEAYRRPGADRRSATEDVLWALLNSKEFIYNH